ncbi:histidine kinase [Georgenia muralis]|uniref:histidine kinase n=2 Tax=Georgenia muralis TaxID=154117 RepID=A0A3N4Z7E2_9MICO|nr:histidine kinase [Georgenia muralis]
MSPVRPERWGLAARLLAATMAVVLVAAGTAWAVAIAIGPAVFHDHMVDTGLSDPAGVEHAERAFRTASAVSLGLALVTALAAAVAVSLFLSRRVTRSLRLATMASKRVAAGDHSVRMPHLGMGREFDDMGAAFNTMAAELSAVEASRTRMLGDLAHEMRTPVATLDGYLEAIMDGVERADEKTLTMLRTQVGRLARLAEDVALVTTAEEGRLGMRREPVEVAALVRSAAELAAARFAARGVDLDTKIDGAATGAVVVADRDRLGQVLTNLLDNALRHTPHGGSVRLLARQDGSAVVIVVSDSGEGIPDEHLPHLFERFYRVDTARDRAHGGSGVGLAIVRAIVQAHDGAVTATSDGPGTGSTFTVTLPVRGSVTAGR